MKILARREEGDRRLTVAEQPADGSRLYYENGILYTHIDAAGGNLLAYGLSMAEALAGAGNVLLLGTAGGALATQLSRRGAAVTAVDDLSAAFELARSWFQMPQAVECIQADALAFLRQTDRRWDAVAVDLYLDGEIPETLLTTEIGGLLRRALRAGGLIVWNVADGPRSRPVHWAAQALRLAGLEAELREVIEGDVGNTLVIARVAEQEVQGGSRTRSAG